MQIGDLVKYSDELLGLGECLGVVTGINGKAVDVQWLDRHVLGSGRASHPEKSTELPEFLEVVSASR